MTTHTATNANPTTRPNSVNPTPEKESSTARRVGESAHSLIDDATAKAEDLERQVREKAAVAGEKYEATKESTSQQIEQSLAKVEGFVRERPMTAAGIAFAAGIVASSILRR